MAAFLNCGKLTVSFKTKVFFKILTRIRENESDIMNRIIPKRNCEPGLLIYSPKRAVGNGINEHQNNKLAFSQKKPWVISLRSSNMR